MALIQESVEIMETQEQSVKTQETAVELRNCKNCRISEKIKRR